MKLNILKSLNLKHSIDNTIATIKQLGDNDICIVVPDKLSATMEKTIFEKLDIDCSFNINVSTLNRLSKNILAETKAKYRTISKIGGIILLKKVLNENQDLIKSFKNDKHSYQIKHPEKDISDIQWSKGSYTIANGILHFKNDFKGKHFWNDPVFFFYGKKLIYNSNSVCIWAEKIDSALK